MSNLDRRDFLKTTTAIGVGSTTSLSRVANSVVAAPASKSAIDFGFSLYGMRSLDIGQALEACSRIGYDCIELPVQAVAAVAGIAFAGLQTGQVVMVDLASGGIFESFAIGDPIKDLGGIYLSQAFPFYDTRQLSHYERFETAVYSSMTKH